MARWFGRAARSESAPSPSCLGHRRPGQIALVGHVAPPASPQAAPRPGRADRAAAPALAPEDLPEGWLAAADGHHDARGPALLRRAIEVLLAAVVLGFTAPLLAAATLAALADRAGPVIERLPRIGRHGCPFTLYRLRVRSGGFGRLLRLCRIADVLQLVNVLKGEMALVGPRPEAPGSAAEHARWIPRWRDREAVRPGITGWAQVHQAVSPLDRGGSLAGARRMLGYDLYYVQHRSLGFDLRILFATLRLVLAQKRTG
jgi:lipopolysaccharide/colanic/teichoic acid biosynthesis glycosyltransferase